MPMYFLEFKIFKINKNKAFLFLNEKKILKARDVQSMKAREAVCFPLKKLNKNTKHHLVKCSF